MKKLVSLSILFLLLGTLGSAYTSEEELIPNNATAMACVLTVGTNIESSFSCDGSPERKLLPIAEIQYSLKRELSGQLAKFIRKGFRVTSCVTPVVNVQICTLTR